MLLITLIWWYAAHRHSLRLRRHQSKSAKLKTFFGDERGFFIGVYPLQTRNPGLKFPFSHVKYYLGWWNIQHTKMYAHTKPYIERRVVKAPNCYIRRQWRQRHWWAMFCWCETVTTTSVQRGTVSPIHRMPNAENRILNTKYQLPYDMNDHRVRFIAMEKLNYYSSIKNR